MEQFFADWCISEPQLTTSQTHQNRIRLLLGSPESELDAAEKATIGFISFTSTHFTNTPVTVGFPFRLLSIFLLAAVSFAELSPENILDFDVHDI